MAAPGAPPGSLIEHGCFFLPGPTEVHPEVLAAQSRPLISHRGGEMERLLASAQAGLQQVLGTGRPVVISGSSATGLMEAGLRTGTTSRVLCLVGGAFAARFARIARGSGLEVETLEMEWGRPHDPEDVAREVTRARPDTVTMVHSETSTGTLNPIPDLVAAVRERSDALVVVDAVSSAGGVPLSPDEWGVDFLLTGSQKALALPPGLAFGVVSERMERRIEASRQPGFYFDLGELLARARRNQALTTPPISTLFALEVQLGRIMAEGLGARFERHRVLAAACLAWSESRAGSGRPVDVLAAEGARSPTVTALTLPPGLSSGRVVEELGLQGFTLATGYGPMKDQAVRIGHMGDHSVGGLERLYGELDRILDGSPPAS